MKLTYVACSVVKGTTDWKDSAGNRYRLDQYGSKTLREIASTDPLVARERYGVPDNIYWTDWNAGEMTIVKGMLKYFEKLPARKKAPKKTGMKMGTLYRPRGINRKTGRTNWITTDWYRSKGDAQQAVKMFGSEKRFKSIKIVSAPSHQYKGQHIKANRISTMF